MKSSFKTVHISAPADGKVTVSQQGNTPKKPALPKSCPRQRGQPGTWNSSKHSPRSPSTSGATGMLSDQDTTTGKAQGLRPASGRPGGSTAIQRHLYHLRLQKARSASALASREAQSGHHLPAHLGPLPRLQRWERARHTLA